MEIFVSDKEENYGAYQSQDIDYHKLNFCNNEPMEIVSLEQHDTEIKAPLLEELETLKTENYHIKQALEFGKSSYASLQEQLELVNKANKDTQELVLEHRQKERRQVIDELCLFIIKNSHITKKQKVY